MGILMVRPQRRNNSKLNEIIKQSKNKNKKKQQQKSREYIKGIHASPIEVNCLCVNLVVCKHWSFTVIETWTPCIRLSVHRRTFRIKYRSHETRSVALHCQFTKIRSFFYFFFFYYFSLVHSFYTSRNTEYNMPIWFPINSFIINDFRLVWLQNVIIE